MSNSEKQPKKKFGIEKLDRFIQIDQLYQRKKFIEINPKIMQSTSVIKVDFTKFSIIFLLSNGRILTKGSNLLGREPINEKHKKVFDFVEFEKLNNENRKDKVIIYDISAGSDYVLALDDNYQLWGWGSNAKKQIDLSSDSFEFIKPKKLSYINENCSFSQIFAFNEASIAVSTDDRIKVWGENKNSILGKSKVTSEKKQYAEKTNLSKFIEKEMLKDDSDITEYFVKTRKIFNTKHLEEIKTEKKPEDNEKTNLMDNENENEIINLTKKISVDPGNKVNEFTKNLEERIKEYDSGLDDVNSNKDSLRIKIKVIDDQINQYKIDHEKILKKLSEIRKVENDSINAEESILRNQEPNANFKDNDEVQQHTKNENSNNSFHNRNSYQNNNTVSKSVNKTKNSRIHEEMLNMTLEKLIGLLDEKKTERNIISNEIEKMVEKENLFFQNKMVLIDMINLLKKYGIKHESEQTTSSKSEMGRKNEFNELIGYLRNIEEHSFLSVFERDSNLGSHKAAENILKESINEIEKIKNSYEKFFVGSGEEQKNKSFGTLRKLIDHKLNMIYEQNNMINCLVNYFHCLPEEVLSQMTPPQIESEVESKKKNIFRKIIGKQKDKNDGKREEICRDMIVKYLKESLTVEEIKNYNDYKKNKLTLVDKNKICLVKDESLNNDYLFKNYIASLKMDDLIVISKYNEIE